jgi:hypothetical protein
VTEPVNLLRRVLPFISVVVFAAVLYDGWTFYARWKSAREGEQAQRDEEVRRARQSIDLLGGTSFRIINFYATPQIIQRGGHANICYGVYGAKSVRIEPPVETLRPAITDCLQVTPRADTAYKLIAEDGAGHTATADLIIKVK